MYYSRYVAYFLGAVEDMSSTMYSGALSWITNFGLCEKNDIFPRSNDSILYTPTVIKWKKKAISIFWLPYAANILPNNLLGQNTTFFVWRSTIIENRFYFVNQKQYAVAWCFSLQLVTSWLEEFEKHFLQWIYDKNTSMTIGVHLFFKKWRLHF